MLNVMVAGLLCISMLPVVSSCNLLAHFVNFYVNIKNKCQAILKSTWNDTGSSMHTITILAPFECWDLNKGAA